MCAVRVYLPFRISFFVHGKSMIVLEATYGDIVSNIFYAGFCSKLIDVNQWLLPALSCFLGARNQLTRKGEYVSLCKLMSFYLGVYWGGGRVSEGDDSREHLVV